MRRPIINIKPLPVSNSEPEPLIVEQEVPELILFRPEMPETIRQTKLDETLVEALILRYLFAVGSEQGRGISVALALPPKGVIEILQSLKQQQLVVYKDTGSMGDFTYTLTDAGRERAKKYYDESYYIGPAPVILSEYIESVYKQTIEVEAPNREALEGAFKDLLITDEMINMLGPAVSSGRGMFLYGFPGNGKTSIAERITSAFQRNIYIPYAIIADGQLIKIYDPELHEVVGDFYTSKVKLTEQVDPRWIKIKRPTVMAGGELTMNALEIEYNKETKVSEAPLQLKANGGTLVIDDFGRQRMAVDELLNRWIVPLEKRFDFLTLASGKKIKVPFDQLIIFSTNLEPKDLVDEAFLRRIPYKINVIDPTDEQFQALFRLFSDRMGFEWRPDVIDYVIEEHYHRVSRSFRCCHPRDLLMQVKNICQFQDKPIEMTREHFDQAVHIYFSVM